MNHQGTSPIRLSSYTIQKNPCGDGPTSHWRLCLLAQFNDGSPVDEDDESAADPDFDPEKTNVESDYEEYELDEYEPDEYEPDDDPETNSANSVEENTVDEENAARPDDGVMHDEAPPDGVDEDEDTAAEREFPQPEELEEIAGVMDEGGAEPVGVAEADELIPENEVTGDHVVPDDDALNQRYGDRAHQYGLRPRKPRS